MEKTYKLRFCCSNCGHIFEKEIPFGIDVDDRYFGYEGSFINSEPIKCSSCGSHKVHKKLNK